MASSRPSPGRVLDVAPARDASRRDRFIVCSCIALITVLAWAYLVHLDRQMSGAVEYEKAMAAMGMASDAPWTIADIFFTFAMWAVMMVGMMVPAASPMLLLFAGTRAGRGHAGVSSATLAFGLGYIAVWTAFSAGATLVQYGLHQATLLSPAMSSSDHRVTGIILLAAGAWQFTPWKGSCLTHCRSPLGFLMTNWRDGTLGALLMGFRHGLFCLGCCWALMCLLFVVGVMNLVWVAALAGFVLIEKVGPAGAFVARLAGAAMMIYGVVVIT